MPTATSATRLLLSALPYRCFRSALTLLVVLLTTVVGSLVTTHNSGAGKDTFTMAATLTYQDKLMVAPVPTLSALRVRRTTLTSDVVNVETLAMSGGNTTNTPRAYFTASVAFGDPSTAGISTVAGTA